MVPVYFASDTIKNTFFFEHNRDNQREGPVPRSMEGSTARTTERSTARFTARSKAWPLARPTANNRRFCLRNGFACVPPLSELAHWVPGAGGQDVRIIRWAGWAGLVRSLRLELRESLVVSETDCGDHLHRHPGRRWQPNLPANHARVLWCCQSDHHQEWWQSLRMHGFVAE
jgi:hypothetical protein